MKEVLAIQAVKWFTLGHLYGMVGHAGLKGTCKQIQNHYNDIIKSKSKLARKKPYLHISHY